MIKGIIIVLVALFILSAAVAGIWQASPILAVLVCLVILGAGAFVVWRILKKKKAQKPGKMPGRSAAKPREYTPEERIAGFLNNAKDATYSYTDVSLYRPADVAFAEAKPGTYVRFKPEPDNSYDKDALMVTDPDGGPLGYMNKGKLRDMVKDFESRWEDTVSGIVTDGGDDVKIALAFVKRNRKQLLKEMDMEPDED